MNAFEFHCPTKIVCGEGALHKLPVKIADRGVTKPLIVTDANLIKLGIAEPSICPIERSRCELFSVRSCSTGFIAQCCE